MTEITPSTTPESADLNQVETPAAEEKKGLHWTHIAMWAAIFGLLALLGWGLMTANETRPEAGQPAPDFTVEFFNGYEWEGRPVSNLDEMRGQPIVLNFWASWCVECRYESDAFEAAWQRHKDDGLVFLGVAYADVEPNSIDYMNEFNLTYPHAPDLGTDISQEYEITGVPETFFIDRDGTIRYVHIGPMNESTLEAAIAEIME